MRLLHVLSQRPSHTGSGITLQALIRGGDKRGAQSAAVIGVPALFNGPLLKGLPEENVFPVFFENDALPFPVPGMSDVMPYSSSVFSCLGLEDLKNYQDVWTETIRRAYHEFRPDIIHSHHVWIVSSLIKGVLPEVPQVIHCHATGLRQMELCPDLAEEVINGCRRADAFCVLHKGHADVLSSRLRLNSHQKISVVGAGYRDDIFKPGPGTLSDEVSKLVYAGKYSAAKGLPQLLDAFELLAEENAGLELHVVGSGAGEEARMLEKRMKSMAPAVVLHGQVDQVKLAGIMQGCDVCVLPSFYEGVPLVLVEALGCGCRLVSTALPGVVSEIAPHVGDALELVDLPRMESVDRPVPKDVAGFVEDLAKACRRALEKGDLVESEGLGERLSHFTWDSVIERVYRVWKKVYND